MHNQKMKRILALFTVGPMLDLFAFIVIYYMVYLPHYEIAAALASGADHFEFNDRMYMCLLGLMLPFGHLIGFIEFCFPKLANTRFLNLVVIFLAILLVAIGITLSSYKKTEIVEHGYFVCEPVSYKGKLADFDVYVKDEESCIRLIRERAEMFPEMWKGKEYLWQDKQ